MSFSARKPRSSHSGDCMNGVSLDWLNRESFSLMHTCSRSSWVVTNRRWLFSVTKTWVVGGLAVSCLMRFMEELSLRCCSVCMSCWSSVSYWVPKKSALA